MFNIRNRKSYLSLILALMMFAMTVAPLFAAPRLAIRTGRLIRGQWNQITFTARPQAGEVLTSFTFSSELPFGGEIPYGCRRMNVPTRSITCDVQAGVMSVTIELFVQQYETKTENNIFFRTWFKGADGTISEVNTTKIVRITNR